MKIFLDTSSLIKLYHKEDGTENLDNLFSENSINEVFLSEIAKVEFNSAIWRKTRTNEITDTEAIELVELFYSDSDSFTFVEVNNELIGNAFDLISKYGKAGLRSLDSIQLASMLKVKTEISYAISADKLLKNLIDLEGIKTV